MRLYESTDSEMTVSAATRTKRVRKGSVFYSPEADELDRDLKAAIKKSMVEKKKRQVCFSKDIPEVPCVSEKDEEVFRNPMLLLDRCREMGFKYGAVKFIPPVGWKPNFSLNIDSMEFQVREQQIHRLASGKKFKHPEETWRAEDLKAMNQRLIKEKFGSETASLDIIEDEYWRIVEHGTDPVTVRYAADLKTSDVGSGFPNTPSNPYSTHPWNLQNLPYAPGSLLKYYHRDVPGITSPWLYMGMIFSSFCWHTEDNFFSAVNYHHFGAPKVWYVVPPMRASSVEKLLKSYSATKNSEDALYSLTVQLPPAILLQNRVPVYRVVQKENEFVVLWPRTFHAGFNAGFNCNEACNLAPSFWLEWGYKSIETYRYLRSTCIPYYQMVIASSLRYHDLAHPQLLDVIKAMAQLITNEWRCRKSLKIPQLPFLLSKDHFPLIQKDDSTLFAEVKSLLKEMEVNSSLVALPASSEDLLYESMHHLVKFPAKDCDNCRTSCYLGCVICPKATDIMCSHCESVSACDPEAKTYLYRFSIHSLRGLLDKNVVFYNNLSDSLNLPKLPEGLVQDIPSLEELYSFEIQNMQSCFLKNQKRKNSINRRETLSEEKWKFLFENVANANFNKLDKIFGCSKSSASDGAKAETQLKSKSVDASNLSRSYIDHSEAKKLEPEADNASVMASTHTPSFGLNELRKTDDVCAVYDLIVMLSWKYLKMTLSSEQEEDDVKFLPSFKTEKNSEKTSHHEPSKVQATDAGSSIFIESLSSRPGDNIDDAREDDFSKN